MRDEDDRTVEFQTQARWRTVLAVVGVALLASQWFVALFQWPGDIPLHRIYDIPAGETMYILVAVATVLFLIAGYGSVPDRVFIIVPMSVFANIVVGMSVDRLGLPFYGDTLGTIGATVIGGPILGLATAGLTAVLWGFSAPMMIPHVVSAAFVALAVSYCARVSVFSSLGSVMARGALIGLINGMLSSLTVLVALRGDSTPNAESFANFFVLLRIGEVEATILQNLICDSIDKTFCLLIVLVLVRYVPPRPLAFFTFSGNEPRLSRILLTESEQQVKDAGRALNELARDTTGTVGTPRNEGSRAPGAGDQGRHRA